MASMKEIQTRMKSIQDTMKITNAMYLISSSKMKKAKKTLTDTEPYFFGVQRAMDRLLRHLPENEKENRYLDQRPEIPPEERKFGLIVVTADKGLNGAYNHNIIKMAEERLKLPGHRKLYVLGVVGRQYFDKVKGVDMDGSFRYTVQKPTMHRARLISETMVDGFLNRELDEVYILFTEMVNSMKEEPRLKQLLPLKRADFEPSQMLTGVMQENISLFPSADEVMDNMVPNYLTGIIYGCLVEAYASEHNARMMAMRSSTDNAGEMLKELSIQYNRARQAAITQEITEVVSGANAQKRKG
ncbi:ATP synthase F1 subunit gamma [[Clostridium] symbiosum]|uniref:ATP synthase F1 subunit gamma n=1 Tax=Clostridium symbiosum TaxID=1512 RepID=UPI001D07878B|nr:ATP synthase F1 subunit gamma [[Clostridium] symbiosum]MCB6608242.1 ATP synthase F1 subunit gamma [[Clostridium] symbiosum]MCB6930804.1 ATP synthase F1 subunit gamma [[Clostridium] symbiosum]